MNKLKSFTKDIWSLHTFKAAIALLVISLITGIYVYQAQASALVQNVLAGIIAGFLVTSFHVIVDYKHLLLHRIVSNSKLQKMLSKRDDREYYADLLKNSAEKIDIMGVTTGRFLSHFGSTIPQDTHSIIDPLLSKGVKLRLLLSEVTGQEFKNAQSLFNKYIEDENVEIRYFDRQEYIPQSIFIIDSQCILGPVLTDRSSKDTAALHFFDKESDYASQYTEYFEKVWDSSNDLANILHPND